MASRDLISPTHRAIRQYYESVEALQRQRVFNEMSTRSPFQFLLGDVAKLKGWTLIAELSGKSGGSLVRDESTLASFEGFDKMPVHGSAGAAAVSRIRSAGLGMDGRRRRTPGKTAQLLSPQTSEKDTGRDDERRTLLERQ